MKGAIYLRRSRPYKNTSNANQQTQNQGLCLRRVMVKRSQQHAGPCSSTSYGLKLNRKRLQLIILPPHYAAFREQNSIPMRNTLPPLYYPMKQGVPVFLVLLTLKYQAKTETTIFQEEAVALGCLIAATYAYWLIVGKMKEESISCTLLWWAALASALLSAISFTCIMLPYPSLSVLVLLPLVISSFVLLPLLYAFCLFIEWAVKKAYAVFVWARGPCTLPMDQV